MNKQLYYEQKKQFSEQLPKFRELCTFCLQPTFSCYCQHVETFDPKITFVILIHPIEVRRRIATGRMSHLCLEKSYLIAGQNFSENEMVNQLIAAPDQESVILYPGINSKNLTSMTDTQRCYLIPKEKKLTIFVIDGTWATAKKMVRQSKNLHQLPRICFTPPHLSNFRVRKQPNPNCFSTLEAIHHTIELLGPSQNFDLKLRKHDRLLHVFNSMVELQLSFIRKSNENPHSRTYRRQKIKEPELEINPASIY